MQNTTLTTKRKINFFQLENELADDGHLVQLKGSALSVYILLCRYTNSSTSIVFPSYNDIKNKTGLDRKTAIDAIAKLEELGYIIKIKKGGKDAGSNHYEIQDIKTVPVLGKTKKNVKPPVSASHKNAPKKERTDIEAIEIPSDVVEGNTDSEAYKAYLDAIEVWSIRTGAKPWKLETFNKKTSRHNSEVLSIAYEILKSDTTNIMANTAKVYLISPDDMISQLYPRIKSVILNRAVKSASEEFKNLIPVVKERAVSENIITLEESDWMKENSKQKSNPKYKEITDKYVKFWYTFGNGIAEKYGINFDGNGGFY